jgi:outer membrane receptor for ferric coprogen and ferric-rhodotorulic acid
MTRLTNYTYLLFTAAKSTLVLMLGLFLIPLGALAQEDDEKKDDIFEISPFVLEEDADVGYMASSTLAGGRLRSNLRDVGSSIQVVTQEFMEDIGATGIDELHRSQ